MKITIYHLVTETQEAGFVLQSFATKEARDDAIWNTLESLWREGGFGEEDKPDRATGDVTLTWDDVRADDLDLLWLEDTEIDVAMPTGAGLLATLQAIAARLNGEFDNPALTAMGPLGDSTADILAWCKAAIDTAETARPAAETLAECECYNCSWRGADDETVEIQNLYQRVSPGEPLPVGECPECGCLCHKIEGGDDELAEQAERRAGEPLAPHSVETDMPGAAQHISEATK